MSTTLLNFTLRVAGPAGPLTDPDNATVLLSDQTGTQAVIRDDNDTAVIPPAPGTAMTRVSQGVYQYSLTDPAQGLTYSWWSSFLFQGVQRYYQLTALGTPVNNYVGRYTTEASLKICLGSIDVRVLSDVDSTGSESESAVAQAIQAAEDEVDSILGVAPSPYMVPLAFGANPISQALIWQVNMLAGDFLFRKRYLEAVTKNAPMYRKMREDAVAWLESVWYSDRVLPGATPAIQKGTGISVSHRPQVNAIGIPIWPNGIPLFPYGCGFAWTGGALI